MLLLDHHFVRAIHSTGRYRHRRRPGIFTNTNRRVSKVITAFTPGIDDHRRRDLGALPLWGIYDLIGV